MIGSEWIKTQLPRSWCIARIRDHATVVNGYPFDSQLFTADNGIPLVRIRDIANDKASLCYAGVLIPEALIHNGDILVGMDGNFNVTRWRGGDALLNQRVCCIRPTDAVDAGFLYYVLPTPLCLINEFTYSTTVKHLSSFDILNIHFPYPPLSLQRTISDYLERETARLDALVAAKQRVLELLAEKRQALITRAVSRGLDPSTPLRDTGIPWLGEMPAHWEVWKLGHTALIGNGSTPSRSNTAYWSGGTIPWLNSSVVNQYEATRADQFVTETALRKCHLPLVKSGSVLVAITGQGKTRGKAVVLSFDATINQHLAYVSPDPSRLDPWFLRWTLLSAYGFLRSISDDAGGTKGALTCEVLAHIRVPVPPVCEQRAIAASVAIDTEELESLRKVVTRTIALLKERRATLIASAVSGQINVVSAA